jgi:prepilin-type N-terminal cleavage/methylation domain-containing protein
MRSRNQGFSLIELVVVVSILVLLAGVLIPLVGNEMGKAMVGRATADMRTASDAFNRYYIHTGFWPTTVKTYTVATSSNLQFTKMDCLYTNVHARNNWNGPYFNGGSLSAGAWSVAVNSGGKWSGFTDPWGNPFYLYYFAKNDSMGPSGGIAIVSAGRNGVLDSTAASIGGNTPTGDDIVMPITRSL